MDEKLTIEALADELGVTKVKVKEALEMKSMTPNATELTDEQEATVRNFDFAAPDVAVVEKKAPKKKGPVTFYWRSKKRPSFTLGKEFDSNGNEIPAVTRIGKNGVMILNPADAGDARMIKHLKKHSGNEANGGIKFANFELALPEDGSIANRFDKLMGLNPHTLTQLAAEKMNGSVIKAGQLTDGQKIEVILGLGE